MDAADGGNSKRNENPVSTLLRNEKPTGQKSMKCYDGEGFFIGEVVIPEEGAKTRAEDEIEIFRHNLNQLIAENSPKMSSKQLEWISCFNKWVNEKRSCSWVEFPGGPPPIPESGDPGARARVKVNHGEHFHPVYVRVAEMAIQFYNKYHEGSDFEVVELLSVNIFMYIHQWAHINFRAKPKNASSDDDVRTFFAEHFLDDFSSYEFYRRVKVTEGVISTCCLLEEGSSTKDPCGHCSSRHGVRHPINNGYVFHPDATFKIQELVGVAHTGRFQKSEVCASKGVSLPSGIKGPQMALSKTSVNEWDDDIKKAAVHGVPRMHVDCHMGDFREDLQYLPGY